ncbi:MAG: alpha/beta hydrolase [Sphingomonas sp.]|uniref:esterase/lipase family protein n=1 Tax=Sphingomonas sp. TaxID=28214 RepID=UPI0011F666ED|nr:alpha/beta hydrolase [Sphingomonas sp.]THD37398.1 MAG: alpha/beta hydrolase [Sphingomonas sp.]
MASAAPEPSVKAPSALLALTELPRALFELAALPWAAPALATAPNGDGHPVIVLPGFVTSDRSTGVLRGFLKQHGYQAHTWDLGRNLGPKAIGRHGEKLIKRVLAVYEESGQKVSLVGWSLGGVMARLVAKRIPHAIRQVITLGSPFSGSPKASNVWRAYEVLTGQKIDGADTKAQLNEVSAPPPVPSTAIYSRADGVVAWQNCCEEVGPMSDNIEVHGSHCGLGVNASVLYAIADRLAQPEGDWHPFERTGVRAFVYPSAGHA